MDLTFLIWIGAAMSVCGLVGLGYCIREAARIKGAKLQPEEIHTRLKSLVVVNIGSVFLAFMGLALIAFALILN